MKRVALIPATLVSVMVAVACSCVSAQAVEVHVLSSSFGGAGTAPGELSGPQGVAVNDSTSLVEAGAGDVYVVDQGNNRVERFSSSGVYLGQFNGSGEYEVIEGGVAKKETGTAAPTGVLSGPVWIAVDDSTSLGDPSKGDVYVTDNGHDVIDKFTATGAYLGQITGTCENKNESLTAGCPDSTSKKVVPFSGLYGVAVDPAGTLWAATPTPNGEIDNYSDATATEFLESRENQYAAKNNGHFCGCSPTPGFAVGPEGDLYTNTSSEFVKLDSAGGGAAGGWEAKLPIVPNGGGTSEVTADAAAVDLVDGDAYVDSRSAVYAFNSTISLINAGISAFETFGSGSLSAGAGVAVNSSTGTPVSGSVYVADAAADRVDVFGLVSIPGVESEPASNVEVKHEAGHASVDATLHGTVKPGGLPITGCEFEYGTDTSYGRTASCVGPDASEISSGAAETSVKAEITGLRPNSTYHFRLRAANANDESDLAAQREHAGKDESFPVPFGPSVVSEAPATGVTASTATLSGEVNPGGLPLSECYFEYGPTGSEQVAACEQPDAGEIGEGTAPVMVHADLQGLQGATTYRYRLVARTEVFSRKETVTVAGKGRELTTAPVPVITDAEAVNVTATSAELRAEVNPEGVQVSYCKFEYGTSTSYEETAKCAQTKSAIGAGTAPVEVSAELSELQPNTTYHWRLDVKDENGEALAVDHTFAYNTTGSPPGSCPDEQARQERGSLALPDCRAYELVTPAQKNGTLPEYFATNSYPTELADNGQRVMTSSLQCFGGSSPSCAPPHGAEGQPYEFERTNTGWVTRALAPPAATLETDNFINPDADTDLTLFTAPTTPEHEGESFYAREPNGTFVAIGPLSEATTHARIGFGGGGSESAASTRDLSHLVYDMPGPKKWSFDHSQSTAKSVYEYTRWCGGQAECEAAKQPLLVGVSGPQGSDNLIGTCSIRFNTGEAPGESLSGDGRTVYFEVEACGEGTGAINEHVPVPVKELFARVDGEGAQARTVAISEPQASEEGLSPGSRPECEEAECVGNTESPAAPATNPNWRDATFAGASADGSRVFFMSEQQLTDSASESEGNNLYESECEDCEDLSASEEHGRRHLLDLSAGEGGTVPGGPRVQGAVAISPDGSHVYFVAQGKLASNRGARGTEAVDGQDNLYAYTGGHLAFIATLSPADERQWKRLQGNVTPDGRFLVFSSYRKLTPDVAQTEGPAQVYEYDAQTGALVRVSVGEDGFNDNGNDGVLGPLLGIEGYAGNATVAAPRHDSVGGTPPRSDPSMADDGSFVFFQSPVALTPGALNDVAVGSKRFAENVYEYHEGHVYLISDGKDTAGETQLTEIAVLVGSDTTGRNVFFWTFDPLVPEDTDTQRDLYDAHVCSEDEPCSAPAREPVPCAEGSCQAASSSVEASGPPASETFSGVGNLSPLAPVLSPLAPPGASKPLTRAQKLAKALKLCREKHNHKKRLACEKQARKAYTARKANSSSHRGTK